MPNHHSCTTISISISVYSPHIYIPLPSFTFLFFYHYTYSLFASLPQFSLSDRAKKQMQIIRNEKERERCLWPPQFNYRELEKWDRWWVPRRNCVGAIERRHQWATDTCTPSILVLAIHGSDCTTTIAPWSTLQFPPISNVYTSPSFCTFLLIKNLIMHYLHTMYSTKF